MFSSILDVQVLILISSPVKYAALLLS